MKVELEIRALRLCATKFAEALHCYGRDTTSYHYRSMVEYRPKMTPVRYSDTQYILPKRLTLTYVSYVDVSGPSDPPRHKVYRSSVEVHPVTVSNVVVGGFRWLSDREADVQSFPDPDAASRFASENDEKDDERQLAATEGWSVENI